MRAALAVLAVVPVVAGCAEARALPCRDLPGTAVRILPSPHIAYAGTSHAPYSSSPPTSGPHVPFTVAPGVYREPLARELQVHALEHGHVLVQYPVEIAGAGRRDVEDSARRHVRDVIVAPSKDVARGVVLTGWGRIERLPAYDSARVDAFVLAFAGRYVHGWRHGARLCGS